MSRYFRLLLFCFALSCPALHGESDEASVPEMTLPVEVPASAIYIGNVEYVFTYTNWGQEAPTYIWEYLPKGQTLDAWHSLVSITETKFPQGNLADYIQWQRAMIESMDANVVGAKFINEEEAVLAYVISDPEEQFSEVNIWHQHIRNEKKRFVLGHQLAFRYYGSGHKEAAHQAVIDNMNTWVGFLKEAVFPSVEDFKVNMKEPFSN